MATVNGRAVAMAIPCGNREFPYACGPYCRETSTPCFTYFEGRLQPAGLIDGSLKVRPDRGRYRWLGSSRRPIAVIRLVALYRGGKVARTTVRVPLQAGYG
jgi:hypothetical protein